MLGLGYSWDRLKDIPNLSGKVAFVTGGNAGIGFEITRQLAARGAKVYLAARSEQRARDAIRKIEEAHPEVKKNGTVIWLPLDLTHPANVVKSATDFMEREQRLDILVNNAARLASSYEPTDYGVDLSVAINHIGHFVLVDNLMSVLKATATQPDSDVRIAIMSSSAQFLCPKVSSIKTVELLNDPWPGFATPTSFVAATKRYSFTKLLNELFKIELQKRLSAEGSAITVLSMNPGLVATENSLASFPVLLRPLVWTFGETCANGATSALFATTAAVIKKEPEKYKGAYIESSASRKPAATQAVDTRLADEAWTLTREIIDKVLDGKM